MSGDNRPTDQKELRTEEKVREYLKAHPDFFDSHPDLLETLALAHESGGAVSLVERQVSILRERNMEMRHRLANLLENARTNDRLFEKTKRMVLSLLDAGDLAEAVDNLYNSLGTDYQIQFYSLLLLGDLSQMPASKARVVSMEEAQSQIGTLLRTKKAICGVLRAEESQYLFGDKANKVGSVAAVPLSNGNLFGILAIGNADANYYRSTMGTLFLSYIAEVLNRTLPRFNSP